MYGARMGLALKQNERAMRPLKMIGGKSLESGPTTGPLDNIDFGKIANDVAGAIPGIVDQVRKGIAGQQKKAPVAAPKKVSFFDDPINLALLGAGGLLALYLWKKR